ncbi:Deacetylase [subsurface metagenome]
MKRIVLALLVSIMCFCSISIIHAQQTGEYDLILKGGHVIDPLNNIDGKMDVAVLDGKIALVAKNIPPDAAKQDVDDEGMIRVIDAEGYYVAPGSLDIHAHTNYPGENRINARDHCFNSGVTTICDAGSMGANNIQDMLDLYYDEDLNIEGYWNPRVLAFLSISANGSAGRGHKAQFNVPLAVEVAKKYPGIIVGFKSYCMGDYDGDVWADVDASIEASRQTGLPVMYDFSQIRANGDTPSRSYNELITEKMLPGHIHTHWSAQQFPVLLNDGTPNPNMVAAQKRGIIFDVGHGSGSMVFRNAYRLIQQGFYPNSISTDLHGRNSNSPVYNMTNVMSKFLCMGMSLEHVIRCSTINPANEINHPELGHLSVGAVADIAVLEVIEGNFTYTDCSPGQNLTGGGRFKGNRKIQSVMTLFGGNIVHDIIGLSYRWWDEIPEDDAYWRGQFRYQDM